MQIHMLCSAQWPHFEEQLVARDDKSPTLTGLARVGARQAIVEQRGTLCLLSTNKRHQSQPISQQVGGGLHGCRYSEAGWREAVDSLNPPAYRTRKSDHAPVPSSTRWLCKLKRTRG